MRAADQTKELSNPLTRVRGLGAGMRRARDHVRGSEGRVDCFEAFPSCLPRGRRGLFHQQKENQMRRDTTRLDEVLSQIPDRREPPERDAEAGGLSKANGEPERRDAEAATPDLPLRPSPHNMGESSADTDWPSYNKLGGANPVPRDNTPGQKGPNK